MMSKVWVFLMTICVAALVILQILALTEGNTDQVEQFKVDPRYGPETPMHASVRIIWKN